MSDKPAEDDELSIDFSAIKNFFKSLANKAKKKKEQDANEEEELSVDWGRAVSFCKNHPTLIFLILVIILQLLPNAGFLPWGGVWMRLYTQELPAVDEWARNSVYNYYRNQVADAIGKQYPNLPDANKAKLIDEQLDKLLKGQEGEVSKQIEGTAGYLKSFYQYEANGRTFVYMPDIDPYFYLRRAENYINTGQLGDTIKDGKDWDTHQLAPIGVPVNKELHYYVLAYMHKLFRLFNPNTTPMQSATYFPIVFVLLGSIFTFLIGNRLAGAVGGIFASVMLSINTAGIGRTPWGHADTDAYNLFFPALIIWLFIESFEAGTARKRHFAFFLTALSTAIYAFAWTGWWYLFNFILAALGLYFIYLVFTRYKAQKNIIEAVLCKEAVSIAIYAVGFIFLVGIFFSILLPNSFLETFLSPFKFTIIKSAAHASLWPNVYTTVAELNPINVRGIIDVIGGQTLFGLALLGIFLISRKKNQRNIVYALLLIIWLGSTMYASTKGVRFTLLMVPAFSIAFGICAGLALQHIKLIAKRHINMPAFIITPLVIILFAVFILQSKQVQGAYQNVKNSVPIVDDAWWNALTTIKEQTPKNSIINSWWDFGHHFKYIADRGVTFDGGTQNSPMAHWIGRVLITENENEAVGILRMLDCGNHYEAWSALWGQTSNDTIRSVNILHKIFPVNKEQAREILVQEKIMDPEIVLNWTHCEPPENYFITSEDMIGKSGVWSHFGSWNFEKAYIWLVLKNQPKEEAVQYMIDNFNYTKTTAEQLLYESKALPDENAANQWIAPWPGYASGLTGCDFRGTARLECGGGVQIDIQQMDARIVQGNNIGIPKYFVYINETTKELQKAEYNNSNVNVAIILVPRGASYSVVLSTPELAASMFTRLFFMEGHGLQYFQPFTSQHQITGGDIFVYKTDWKQHEPNIISALKPKTVVSSGDRVTVNYIGYLQNGTIFDASIPDWTAKKVKQTSDFNKFKTAPMTFIIGSGQTIKGFDNAILGMNLSETKTFNVSPEEGYGTDPTKHPLANQTLFFKVKVEGVR